MVQITEIKEGMDLKSLIIGSAIATILVIIGLNGGQLEYAYPFASIGFLYVGYNVANWKISVISGAVSTIPIILLVYFGKFGAIENIQTLILMIFVVLIVGIFVSLIGTFVKRDREKSKLAYEKKQQIGKNKKKKRNKEK